MEVSLFLFKLPNYGLQALASSQIILHCENPIRRQRLYSTENNDCKYHYYKHCKFKFPNIVFIRRSQVLPALVDVIGQLPSQVAKLHLPCLQFIYWALLQLNSNEKQVYLLITLQYIDRHKFQLSVNFSPQIFPYCECQIMLQLYFTKDSIAVRICDSKFKTDMHVFA